MKTDLYTSDAICRSMGLPAFERDPACTGAVEAVRLLLKPSFHPEICLTFADGQVSVVCAREMIWRQFEPSPTLTHRANAAIPAGKFEALLASLVPAAHRGANWVPGIVIDGMPTEVLHFQGGVVVQQLGGNGGRRGDFAEFLALAVATAWQSISSAQCRNSLADAGEYLGERLPRQTEPPRKPVVETLVLGSEEDREQVLQALRRQHPSRMIDSTAPSLEARRPLYARLMRRRGETLNVEAEAWRLREVLMSAPGAEQVKVVGWHRKGGYEVGLVLVWSEFDAFIAHLEAHDWMSVI